uniref:phospholipase A2 n=1 Tax=Timema genevievae TaxID=629358 RepID=A0A7R9K8Z8_TIMGE|nr:unnamed protein product [Timema genevievae]
MDLHILRPCRSKRELTDVLIVPGTKWCGPHQLASRYVELGPLSLIDRCCRKHDHCRIAIPGFSNKYHFFNYRPFTLSHCGCDSRIRVVGRLESTVARWREFARHCYPGKLSDC